MRRGPTSLDDVIAGVLREAKLASTEPLHAPLATELRKLATAVREVSEPVVEPTYADLYTVKEALYGR